MPAKINYSNAVFSVVIATETTNIYLVPGWVRSTLKFRDGDHFAALDGGSVTLALATAIDHPLPGQVVVGIKTDDVDGAARAIEENGGGIVKGPYNDAHERRAVVYDNKGNGLVFYASLAR